ncbi:carboxylesterase family protein-like protein [Acephala macrosclerotiorum]|nr:carboxylesterase family protein-like protein [Acephala macrosclerotiorum]
MRTSTLLPLAAAVVSARNATTTSASMPTVTLDYSTIVAAAGNTTAGYYKYQNIRFATVPTGDLRWAAPQWPPVETEVNTGTLADEDVDCASTEDCLGNKSLPVLIWTYGGGFTGATNFVFVAYNYRLGMTGLANGPSFLHNGGTSNTAIWDVQQAFDWTKKYISSFGGNPDEITAVGFSAGASRVLFQMTKFAGRAEQPFKQAYVMSPGFVPGAGHHHAEMFWQNVSSTVGCSSSDLTCMRAVDFDTLTTAASDIIADTYEAQLYQKRLNFSGPLVISHELHEANSQAYSGVNTTTDVLAYLKIFFPAITDDVVDEILALYPKDGYTSPGLRFADMKQSFDLTAHNLALTHAMNNQTWNAMVALDQATHGTDQSYIWYSTYTLSSSTTTTTSNSTSTSSAIASSSSSAASNSTTATGPTGGMGGTSSVNATIAVMMQKYLMSFVLTGNPNTLWSEDKINWPMYSNDTTAGTQLVFNTTFYLDDDNLANEKSLYWNKALWY